MTGISGGRPVADDEGMGLIEIVVSMFILAIIAMAFLPLLVQGITQSAGNVALATATQLVSKQLELARALPTTCGSVTAFGGTAVPLSTDSRGVGFAVIRAVGPCPTVYPGTVRVSATVTRLPGQRYTTAQTLATATTLVYVASA